MNWIGIDPGMKGGLALVSPTGQLIEAIPMVVNGKEVDGYRIARLFEEWQADCGPLKVMIEQVGSMPGQGVASTFRFGQGFGTLLGVVQAGSLSLHRVRPQKWKKDMGLTNKDKDASRHLATEIWPEHSDRWQFKYLDGVAEAALIAEWARREGL